MKYIFFFLVLLSCAAELNAQIPSCCVKPTGSGMMAMMTDAEFKAAHEPPMPFSFQSEKGSMVNFETLDGAKGQAYYVPSAEPTSKVLILFHEWWGLNDYIKKEAVRWQELLGNVDVYAIDLYDGKVATTSEEASKLSSGLDKTRTDNLIKGMLVKAGKDKLIATLGWCLGGSYAFRASVLADAQAAGCVMYYGFPEKDTKRIKPLKTDILYNWASQDHFITRAIVDSFQTEVLKTGRKFRMETYDAVHAFANPSNPKYDKEAAGRAETLSVAFLKEKLQLE